MEWFFHFALITIFILLILNILTHAVKHSRGFSKKYILNPTYQHVKEKQTLWVVSVRLSAPLFRHNASNLSKVSLMCRLFHKFRNLIICYIKMECFRNPVTVMERQTKANSLIPPLYHRSMYHSNWNVKSSISVKYWSAYELFHVVSRFSSVTYHSAIKEDI